MLKLCPFIKYKIVETFFYFHFFINSNKDAELQDERKEFEQFKRNLQRKMTEVEEELDSQRRELETSKYNMHTVINYHPFILALPLAKNLGYSTINGR